MRRYIDLMLFVVEAFSVSTEIVFVTEEKTQTMRIPAMTGVLAVLVLAASAVNAADIKSGLQQTVAWFQEQLQANAGR